MTIDEVDYHLKGLISRLIILQQPHIDILRAVKVLYGLSHADILLYRGFING
jgi:hypothetical protein